jgi:hypothetical protein
VTNGTRNHSLRGTGWDYGAVRPLSRWKELSAVFARAGDRLVVHGHHVGEPDRDAEILEVQHEDGSPPYLVRWSDSGRGGLVFPGPDAYVQHFEHDTSGG